MSLGNEDVAASITRLRLKFPGEQELLFHNMSLTVRKGEKMLLLGPSGCGKSTLLQVLSGLIPRTIEVPMKCDAAVIPSLSGIVFQDPDTQFCMSYADEELAFVLENNQVPREQMPSRIRELLMQVGLPTDDIHMPIASMSQGMKQRLAIASVLAMKPEVLFLDEPTALLDEEGTTQVWDTIRNISADQTLVIVEHKINEIVHDVDRIVVLSAHGEIIADGSAEEVFHTHRQALSEYGVWYPGVWDESSSPRWNESMIQQKGVLLADCPSTLTRTTNLLELEHFSGLRGVSSVIYVEQALVQPGDWIGVIGENGAGKSSLLLSMMRLLRTQGRYCVDGIEVGTTEQLAERIGFAFQNPELQFVANTVRRELEYSLPKGLFTTEQRGQRVNRMLVQFGLERLDERHPYQLSLGQKRRLSIATAMIRKPEVLLLDEPTFGQDARNTFVMLDMLEQLRAAGTAIVMVTHDPEIVRRYCTDIWRIQKGGLQYEPVLSPS
ncbi:ABC transporter ATP-binding protein [Paenibacillus sp. CMAA1739]|uniref:ABC transporter ATP-binding protein n=1 Tax=Paenibacillus ottowii TaxID=2315729 RepID=UPI002730D593|nr:MULTISPECIES: ABC transporter ATP-binding protein [Paenibacillus]MDP1510027.1 ABC transporter ATP-binding protein [Paenibacillus ottowii]MEC4567994.1 ABC transporter ATP-binding protein [Paenibacillus sp. CMAA1739]